MSPNALNLQYIINIASSLEELRGSLDVAQCVEFTIYCEHFLFLGGARRIGRCRPMRGIYNILLIFPLPCKGTSLQKSDDVPAIIIFFLHSCEEVPAIIKVLGFAPTLFLTPPGCGIKWLSFFAGRVFTLCSKTLAGSHGNFYLACAVERGAGWLTISLQ